MGACLGRGSMPIGYTRCSPKPSADECDVEELLGPPPPFCEDEDAVARISFLQHADNLIKKCNDGGVYCQGDVRSLVAYFFEHRYGMSAPTVVATAHGDVPLVTPSSINPPNLYHHLYGVAISLVEKRRVDDDWSPYRLGKTWCLERYERCERCERCDGVP